MSVSVESGVSEFCSSTGCSLAVVFKMFDCHVSLVAFLQEERFLFPVYPFFTMGAALCLDRLQVLLSWLLS